MARGKGTGSVYKPKGTSFYWVAYWSGGKRHFESSKSTRKKDAQDILADRTSDTRKGLVVTPKMGKITLRDGLKAVVANLKMNGRKSVKQTQGRIDDHVLEFFSGDRRMNTISTADIEQYKAHRIEEGAENATVNRELAIVRRAFRLAVRGGELVAMPHVPMLRESNTRTGFFEAAEFDAVVQNLPTCLQAPLRFAYVTGWRMKSEVLPLTANRVDLNAGVVRLDPGSTKNGMGRTFHLTTGLRDVLKTQLESIAKFEKSGKIVAHIFHWEDGRPIRDFRKAWEKATVDAGCAGMYLHDCRRTAVRNLERAGVPRSTAMAMVGHQTEAIYRRYAIVDEAMSREGAEKLNAWQNEQQAKVNAARRGVVKRFKKRQAS